MHKSFIILGEQTAQRAAIRRYGPDDFEGLIDIQRQSFPPPFPPELWWNEAQLREHVGRFQEGALCAEIDGRLAGSMTALRVGENQLAGGHTWAAITDDGYIRNHDPQGQVLYVVDICVAPAYRATGIGKWLMQSMYEVVVHLGLSRLVGGGRMPNYHRHAATLSPDAYVERVIRGELRDPVLSFLLRCGRMPAGTVRGYLEDEESCDCAALMEWRNPFFI
ncbi:GNAT family N-acetyltransferase [Paenibacillus sp. IB182496]|uniref:GNAT family N-acetyltransferase n=1 Tax=Paenibacillus sabuli TaxID=2772509 RepID=A0A927BY98_9BACL|nr:GNAT family N-acetyltransferase [Paenibacillus sabuli]MBD2847955.1 GNAT family N-acetyltransferase [Paenibacillus sabuli]